VLLTTVLLAIAMSVLSCTIYQNYVLHYDLEAWEVGTELFSLLLSAEWIEVIGILLDNAIEASPKGSTVFLSSKKQGDFLELTAANPAPPLSNTEFMALFGKGVTTKANRDGHGFGLYNILRMTERYHGKILTRNESILNENYVVFGVLMP
jgi:two-component system, LytTR family, sensor histidine kinase AgrC